MKIILDTNSVEDIKEGLKILNRAIKDLVDANSDEMWVYKIYNKQCRESLISAGYFSKKDMLKLTEAKFLNLKGCGPSALESFKSCAKYCEVELNL